MNIIIPVEFGIVLFTYVVARLCYCVYSTGATDDL